MVSLTKRQGTLYYALESAIYRSKPTDDLVAELTVLCLDLETKLRQEDERLTEQGTDPDLDDRWILNLRRFERMNGLLIRAATQSISAESAA